jgi:alpha-L-glutamate ligase-like protein
MFFATPSQLKRAGIIGMNRRNVLMIAQNNPRHLYPLVDNKLKTKNILEEAGIAAPKLIGVVKTQRNVRELNAFLAPYKSFVIKPAKGSGGKGILVISDHNGDNFVKPNGAVISIQDVCRHASNTISGMFSLGGNVDVAMIEEMVEFSDVFEGLSFQGIPDIRVIVFKGYPVMAMIRLSTSASDGKANLHQGAVGVGIDIATGTALKAVQFGRPITRHPDTGKDLSSFSVPDWQNFLSLASRCYEITKLGYLGVDIVLDAQQGPLILELNARPGLAIQIANGQGLQARIYSVIQASKQDRTPDERVAFSMSSFQTRPIYTASKGQPLT